MEAVLASDESEAEAAANARMDAVYDALNRLESPNFFIGMELRGAPETPPPARQIRAFLEEHLVPLNPDELAQTFREGASPVSRTGATNTMDG